MLDKRVVAYIESLGQLRSEHWVTHVKDDNQEAVKEAYKDFQAYLEESANQIKDLTNLD